METNQHAFTSFNKMPNRIIMGIAFIAAGVIMVGHNAGTISDYWYNIFISWQMLLILIGMMQLVARRYTSAVLFILIGGFFILPIIGNFNASLFQFNWPNILIIIGVIILFHLFKPRKKEAQHCYKTKESFGTSASENGFVKINDVFTSSKLIVLDPVFKGAQIRCSFAGTILDLRRTKLEDKETYIEIDCDFGGINIFVPENWKIKTQMNTFVGSCDDKRFTDMAVIDTEHTLFICGKLSFGGIELR